MRKFFPISIVLVCAMGSASQAAAQLLRPPPRSANGLFGGPRAALDPDRTGHELSSNVSMLGSLEDDLTPNRQGVTVDPFLARRSGTAGALTADLIYRYGNVARSIEASGQTFVHSFRNLGVTPMYGGNANLRANTQIGRRLTLTGIAELRHQPTFTLTSMGPSGVETDSGAPADPTIGALEMRSQNVMAGSSVAYEWTARQRTSLTYGYDQVRVTGSALPTRSHSQEGTLGHNWDIRRSVALQTSYKFADLSLEAFGQPTRPSESQTGHVGFQLRKRVSRTRTVSFTGGGGAMSVKTTSASDGLPLEYVAPSGLAGARVDLGRTWSVAFDAHRDISVLDGVTTQSFLTDMVTLWLGGRIGRAWTAAFSGSWSQGHSHESEVGSFESNNATAQVQYSFTRCCSLVGDYAFYSYQLRDISAIPVGLPTRFERNALTMGVTIFMPIYGQFPSTGRN